uniref:Uncharacterized protein n=1 Tax=Arundo donax TaxID=35708 RepID=A0A0A9ASP6_ARUDO
MWSHALWSCAGL